MKPKYIEYYLQIADLTSQLSYAKRLKVGSIIVKNHRIISCGYNGTVAGQDNTCETATWVPVGNAVSRDGEWVDESDYTRQYDGEWVLKTKPNVIHAEANSITKLARDGQSGLGATLFCTHAPCIDCAKLIVGSGINSVYYRDVYRDDYGLDFLKECGVEVTRYEQEESEVHP